MGLGVGLIVHTDYKNERTNQVICAHAFLNLCSQFIGFCF